MFIKLTIFGTDTRLYSSPVIMRVNVIHLQGYWETHKSDLKKKYMARIHTPPTNGDSLRYIKESVEEIDEMVQIAEARIAKVLFGVAK